MNAGIKVTPKAVDGAAGDMAPERMNRALRFTNRLLNAKLSDLETSISDLHNLIDATDIAVIFLDTDYRIRRFTRAACDLLGLTTADIDRPLDEVAQRIGDPSLADDSEEVLDRLVAIDRNVMHPNDCSYVRRMLPYRTPARGIKGVVITYVDVTAIQQSAAALAARIQQQALVAQIARMALFSPDLSHLLDTAVERLRDGLKVDFVEFLRSQPDMTSLQVRAESGRRSPASVMHEPIDRSTLYGYALAYDGSIIVPDFATERRFGTPRRLREERAVSVLTATVGPASKPFGLLTAATREKRAFDLDDVSFVESIAHILGGFLSRREAEVVLGQRATALSLATEVAGLASVRWLVDGGSVVWDARFAEIAGLDPEIGEGSEVSWLESVYPADRERLRRTIQELFKGVVERETIYFRVLHADGTLRHLRATAGPLRRHCGEILGVAAMILDIGGSYRSGSGRKGLSTAMRRRASVRELDEMPPG